MSNSRFQPDDANITDITPPDVFFNRRRFMQATGVGILAGPIACAGSTSNQDDGTKAKILAPALKRPDVFPAQRNDTYVIPEAIENKSTTDRVQAGTHNNFYEFIPGRAGPVWQHTDDFTVEPWSIEVTGACAKPMTFDLDDLFKFQQEERLYHFRCVERWAMNVPWTGFPMRELLEKVEPTSEAKYLRLYSAHKPDQMPGIADQPHYPWPYFEGLRMDEAMNELAIFATGVYGEPLPKQHGAPIRAIVPWKYGYKNPKSIVKIELVAAEPETFWRQLQPHEYGFLSNVNPNIPHPRWSQARSFLLGVDRVGSGGMPTPIFNGYGEFVADLYPDEPTTRQQPLRSGQIAR